MTKIIVFPGQGSQKLNMGKSFYDNSPAAKSVFDLADKIMGYSITDIIFGDDASALTDTQNSQLALLTVSIAALRALEEKLGYKLSAKNFIFAGHSLGEYAALHASGALELEEAMQLLKARGAAMKLAAEANPGGMAAILGGNPDIVNEIINKASEGSDLKLQVANYNTAGQIVISGHQELVDRASELAKEYRESGVKRAMKLPVSGAFHSSLMQSAQDEMQQLINNAKLRNPECDVISNFTAKASGNSEDLRDALLKQITGSVRWEETMKEAKDRGCTEVIEIGSGQVLSGLFAKSGHSFKISNLSTFDQLQDIVDSF